MKLSVLVAARKDSKYLSKFLFGFFEHTNDLINIELLVMLNVHDTWNIDLVSYFEEQEDIQFFYENHELGRAGLHVYLNDLYEQSTGDWIIYFCEDHFITTQSWDKYLFQVIDGGSRAINGKGKERHALDYRQPYCIIPKFDNVGAMNQVLSRGYLETLGQFGQHGNIDSYFNDVNLAAGFGRLDGTKYVNGDRVILMDDAIFHDFTHDIPNPMDQTPTIAPKAVTIPKYNDERIQNAIKSDAEKLKKAINA